MSQRKKELKFRTFDSLLADVSADFSMYEAEGMIEPGVLIKIALKINYELGGKIHKIKETILDISNGYGKLPVDMDTLIFAAGLYNYREEAPSFEIKREVDPNYKPCCESCCEDPEAPEVITTIKEHCPTLVRCYTSFQPITIEKSRWTDLNCPNLFHQSRYWGQIKDGFLYTNIEEGRVFVVYHGNMEDEEGNLLVLDHPLINEYMETALKVRILENLWMNGEDTANKLSYMKEEMRKAKGQALNFINTPDFQEIREAFYRNRHRQYQRYYNSYLPK